MIDFILGVFVGVVLTVAGVLWFIRMMGVWHG